MVRTLSNLHAKFKRREAKMSQPDSKLEEGQKKRIEELEATNAAMASQEEEMKKRLEEDEARVVEAQKPKDGWRLEKEQATFIYKCNVEAMRKAKEINKKLKGKKRRCLKILLKTTKSLLSSRKMQSLWSYRSNPL